MEWLLSKALMIGGAVFTALVLIWRALAKARREGREEERRRVEEGRRKLQEKYDEIDAETPDVDRAYDDLRGLRDKD